VLNRLRQRKRLMPFILYSHDSWGMANVGTFTTLEEAQTVFQAVCNDRWFLDDGTIRHLSIVEEGAAGVRTVASHSFQRA